MEKWHIVGISLAAVLLALVLGLVAYVSDYYAAEATAVTVMENGEHWFHTEEQLAVLDAWLRKELRRAEKFTLDSPTMAGITMQRNKTSLVSNG